MVAQNEAPQGKPSQAASEDLIRRARETKPLGFGRIEMSPTEEDAGTQPALDELEALDAFIAPDPMSPDALSNLLRRGETGYTVEELQTLKAAGYLAEEDFERLKKRVNKNIKPDE